MCLFSMLCIEGMRRMVIFGLVEVRWLREGEMRYLNMVDIVVVLGLMDERYFFGRLKFFDVMRGCFMLMKGLVRMSVLM